LQQNELANRPILFNMTELDKLLTSDIFKTALISSSVIAAMISTFSTFLFNFFLTNHFKNKDYKLKFNEIILNKRISTYEHVIKIVEELFKVVSPSDNSGTLTLGIFHNIETLNNYKSELNKSEILKFWLNKDIASKLSEFNLDLHNIISQVEKENHNQNLLKSIAESRFQELRQKRDEMISILYTDFSCLHDIDSFIKSKNNKFDYSNESFKRYIEYSPNK
jgi:thioester reductase-like protein